MLKRTRPVLITGLAALVVAGCSGAGHDKPVAGRTNPAPQATAAAVGANGCAPDNSDQSVPRTAPRQTHWERFQGVALPFSPVGPLSVQGDIARCYQHTPRGALMAAVHISVRLDRSTDWQKILKQQVVADEGGAAYARTRTTGRVVPAKKAAQLAGFRIDSYTPQSAVVGTVWRDPARGGRTARTITVKWDGDWKLALTPAGSTGSTPKAVDSLSGYVFWGGF